MQGKQGKETKELGYFKRIIAEFFHHVTQRVLKVFLSYKEHWG